MNDENINILEDYTKEECQTVADEALAGLDNIVKLTPERHRILGAMLLPLPKGSVTDTNYLIASRAGVSERTVRRARQNKDFADTCYAVSPTVPRSYLPQLAIAHCEDALDGDVSSRRDLLTEGKVIGSKPDVALTIDNRTLTISTGEALLSSLTRHGLEGVLGCPDAITNAPTIPVTADTPIEGDNAAGAALEGSVVNPRAKQGTCQGVGGLPQGGGSFVSDMLGSATSENSKKEEK